MYIINMPTVIKNTKRKLLEGAPIFFVWLTMGIDLEEGLHSVPNSKDHLIRQNIYDFAVKFDNDIYFFYDSKTLSPEQILAMKDMRFFTPKGEQIPKNLHIVDIREVFSEKELERLDGLREQYDAMGKYVEKGLKNCNNLAMFVESSDGKFYNLALESDYIDLLILSKYPKAIVLDVDYSPDSIPEEFVFTQLGFCAESNFSHTRIDYYVPQACFFKWQEAFNGEEMKKIAAGEDSLQQKNIKADAILMRCIQECGVEPVLYQLPVNSFIASIDNTFFAEAIKYVFEPLFFGNQLDSSTAYSMLLHEKIIKFDKLSSDLVPIASSSFINTAIENNMISQEEAEKARKNISKFIGCISGLKSPAPIDKKGNTHIKHMGSKKVRGEDIPLEKSRFSSCDVATRFDSDVSAKELLNKFGRDYPVKSDEICYLQ